MSELTKQLRDQPLHLLWGLGNGFVQVAVPWLLMFAGHPIIGLVLSQIAVNASRFAWTLREGRQREGQLQPDGSFTGTGSHVWWDPYLDTAWYVFGDGLGTLLMVGAYVRWGML